MAALYSRSLSLAQVRFARSKSGLVGRYNSRSLLPPGRFLNHLDRVSKVCLYRDWVRVPRLYEDGMHEEAKMSQSR